MANSKKRTRFPIKKDQVYTVYIAYVVPSGDKAKLEDEVRPITYKESKIGWISGTLGPLISVLYRRENQRMQYVDNYIIEAVGITGEQITKLSKVVNPAKPWMYPNLCDLINNSSIGRRVTYVENLISGLCLIDVTTDFRSILEYSYSRSGVVSDNEITLLPNFVGRDHEIFKKILLLQRMAPSSKDWLMIAQKIIEDNRDELKLRTTSY